MKNNTHIIPFSLRCKKKTLNHVVFFYVTRIIHFKKLGFYEKKKGFGGKKRE